ncbi:PD-(D/E)XK nuclease family protein [Thioalkalivibrio sp. ALE23]|uniref:PD-(D/E)XK nuclease family protein n=1 Tax=Thioalkalivibrio sp. ALE23 TaxID=1265495 RepID=UPI00037517B7|nr:PD-(D/E)XK nuclease family protein [Thioalkalivibrio sp. ALE23]
MVIRPTSALTFETCPRMYYYREVAQLQAETASVNLKFGGSVHKTVTDWLTESARRGVFDPADGDTLVHRFRKDWSHITRNQALEYSSTMGPDMVPKVGERLVKQFAEQWPHWGLGVILDHQGEPMVERRLKADIGGGLILSSQPDTLVMSRQRQVFPLDFKTAASPCEEWFPDVSDQLTAQQIVLDAHAEELGTGLVDEVAFGELIKKAIPKTEGPGKGPQVLAPKKAPRRDRRKVREYVEKIHWIAEDIAAERFPARPGSAFNSPCKMCDYRRLCHHDDDTGLVRKSFAAQKAA